MRITDAIKTCSKCGENKAVAEFHKATKAKSGLQSHCKLCDSIGNAKWYQANSDRRKADAAKWRYENPERVKANNIKQYAANSDKVKARAVAWQAANPDKKKASSAKWSAENPEARRIHRHNRRARKLEAGGKLSPGLTDRLFKLQRGECACCKEPLGDDFHLDHIVPIARGGVNEDWNTQLLRSKCNLEKGAKHPIDFMQSRGFLL